MRITEEKVLESHGEPRDVSHGNGDIIVKWNLQYGLVEAPSVNGKRQQWLPCLYCGKLHSVSFNTVSTFCSDKCFEKNDNPETPAGPCVVCKLECSKEESVIIGNGPVCFECVDERFNLNDSGEITQLW